MAIKTKQSKKAQSHTAEPARFQVYPVLRPSTITTTLSCPPQFNFRYHLFWIALPPPNLCKLFKGMNSFLWASMVAQLVKNLPAMQETQVWSLGEEDPLEKGRATHSSILAGESCGQRSPVSYSPRGLKQIDMTERLTHTYTQLLLVG